MSAANSKRKTILFVDDDGQFLELLQPYMERLSNGSWEVLVAANSSTVFNAVDSQRIDLVVIDVRMPVVDGVQLLHLLNRKHPQLRKAMLSGHVDDASRSLAFNGGAELVLEKPRDPAGYQALFAALNELAHWQTEQGFRGVLRRVGLEDIIQMECLSRHSLVLEVIARGNRGRLYIRAGALVHAEFGEMSGEPALQGLLTEGGGEFQHRPFAEPARETLEGSWEFLLMEAVRKRDEAAGGITSENVEEPAPSAPDEKKVAAPVPPPAGIPVGPVINELVVCSDTGEMLYASQSADAPARCQWCVALSKGSARLEDLLPIGTLERVEFVSVPGRMIIRIQDGHGVFLRANEN
jgi:CheY-like chemotaxis protein